MRDRPPFLAILDWLAGWPGTWADFRWKHLKVQAPSSPMRGWDPGAGPSTSGWSRARPAPRVAVVGLLVRDKGAGRAGQVLADCGPGAADTGPDEAHQQGPANRGARGRGCSVRGGGRSRAQLQVGRQGPPAPLHVQQLLVAQRDVLGTQRPAAAGPGPRPAGQPPATERPRPLPAAADRSPAPRRPAPPAAPPQARRACRV